MLAVCIQGQHKILENVRQPFALLTGVRLKFIYVFVRCDVCMSVYIIIVTTWSICMFIILLVSSLLRSVAELFLMPINLEHIFVWWSFGNWFYFWFFFGKYNTRSRNIPVSWGTWHVCKVTHDTVISHTHETQRTAQNNLWYTKCIFQCGV